MSADLTDWLWSLAWTYFKPTAAAPDAPGAWTDTDDPLCTITGSDDERIVYGLNMKSIAAKLGSGKATFADLWNGNVEALARSWPGTGNDLYDASSADQSLANSLAYLFANNGEKVLGIMLEHPGCMLRREKWNRPDYLRSRTIPKALALPKRWPTRGTAPVAAPAALSLAPPPPRAAAVTLIPLPPDSMPVPARPAMVMNGKDKYEACLDYVRRALETEGRLAFDDFRCEVMMQHGSVLLPMNDKDYIDLRTEFERDKNFAPVGKEIMRDAVLAEALARRYDSGIEWAKFLVWDGVPRVERFMSTHFGAVDDAYTRAAGRYMWSGMAGRMLEPGCQLDMVIALQSRQGTKKSTGLKLLAPDPEYFTDGLSLHEDNDNFKRLIKGKVVVEISELAGLSKADINVIKRAITRQTEEWVEKYQTAKTIYKRRCILIATTNDLQFLPPDETGHRRWLPIEITELDRERIKADRDQLWAEGVAIFLAGGVQYAEAEQLAAGRHKKHEQTDVWENRIAEWLTTIPPNSTEMPCMRPLTLSEILEGALRMRPDAMDKRAEKRAGAVLRMLGYESATVRIGDKIVRRWILAAPPPPPG